MSIAIIGFVAGAIVGFVGGFAAVFRKEKARKAPKTHGREIEEHEARRLAIANAIMCAEGFGAPPHGL